MHGNRLRLLAWLALISVACFTALSNIVNFAARPSLPKDWMDESARHSDELVARLDSDSPSARRADEIENVWLLLQAAKRQEGEDAAAALQPIRPQPSGYDTDYVNRLQQLACAELMHDHVQDMLFTMEHLYAYDKEHLKAGDQRIIRDENNLGLVCFLTGQDSPDEAYRYALLSQANDWLHKAASALSPSDKLDALSVRENALMLAEAMKDTSACHRLHKGIDDLTCQLGGRAPQVRL